MLVDDVMLLSLPRRKDRRTWFWQNFPHPWPLPVPQVVDAIEGGITGCTATHLQVLDAALAAGRSVLVLEDDAVFVPDFAARLEGFVAGLPADWGMLMLGGQHFKVPRPVVAGVVQCVDTFRTHAYAVRGPAVEILREVWATSTGHLDHDLHRVHSVVPTYAPQPFLVGQAAGRSDISHLVEGRRFW